MFLVEDIRHRHCQVTDKILVPETAKHFFWQHFRAHMGPHPALDVHDQNHQGRLHQPVGIAGDDARFTLAGRKIIVLMLSFVLQEVKRYSIYRVVHFSF